MISDKWHQLCQLYNKCQCGRVTWEDLRNYRRKRYEPNQLTLVSKSWSVKLWRARFFAASIFSISERQWLERASWMHNTTEEFQNGWAEASLELSYAVSKAEGSGEGVSSRRRSSFVVVRSSSFGVLVCSDCPPPWGRCCLKPWSPFIWNGLTSNLKCGLLKMAPPPPPPPDWTGY